jgi:hypothetical protein
VTHRAESHGRTRPERQFQSTQNHSPESHLTEHRLGDLDPWPCFQSRCMRLPSVAGAALRALADRRRLTAGVGLEGAQAPRRRRSRRGGRLSSGVMFPQFPGNAVRLARRGELGGEEDSARAGGRWPGWHARVCRGGPDPWCSPPRLGGGGHRHGFTSLKKRAGVKWLMCPSLRGSRLLLGMPGGGPGSRWSALLDERP